MIITPHNIHTVPIGTHVEAFWGCPQDTGGGDWSEDARQWEFGLVVDYEIGGSRMFPTAQLVVETSEGREHKVNSITTGNGIGWRIVSE